MLRRWQGRLERALVRLAERSAGAEQAGRYRETLERSRALLGLKAPASRLLGSLGELSLLLGFQVLAIVILNRAGRLDPRDPLPKINLARARLSLANRFLLRAPVSGAVSYNLQEGVRRVGPLVSQAKLPEGRLVECTLLLRRLEDRLALWQDLRAGKLDPAEVRKILVEEDRETRQTRSGKIPSLQELSKLAPRRTGFYYREYRQEQQRQQKRR